MAIPTSRATFKDYCLRNLGFGVIDINVSDDQVDDRIDEALQYFAQYHYDGIEKMYLKYKITQDDLDRAASNDETTATDTIDGTISATFLEGKNFIPMPKKNERRGAKSSTGRPDSIPVFTYSTPSARVKASSKSAVAPASCI